MSSLTNLNPHGVVRALMGAWGEAQELADTESGQGILTSGGVGVREGCLEELHIAHAAS